MASCQHEQNDLSKDFSGSDCRPQKHLSVDMVDWFNERINSTRLKVWIMDHHWEQALGFAKWIPCSAFHPGKTTRHSKKWPIAARGSEPSSWTAYHLFFRWQGCLEDQWQIASDGNPVFTIARLSGRLLPQPQGCPGGDWVVSNKDALSEAF